MSHPILIKQSKKILMKKLKSKFNQLKSIVKEAVKKQPLINKENTSIDTDKLTANEIKNIVAINSIKAEKDMWKNQYLSLIKTLKEKEKIDKLIKSIL